MYVFFFFFGGGGGVLKQFVGESCRDAPGAFSSLVSVLGWLERDVGFKDGGLLMNRPECHATRISSCRPRGWIS